MEKVIREGKGREGKGKGVIERVMRNIYKEGREYDREEEKREKGRGVQHSGLLP